MTDATRPRRDDVPAYDPSSIERKWQERWDARGTNGTDIENGERRFYALMMFPYPSAEGLHVGNLFAFTGNDIFARFHRLQGRTVFEPMGFDAFGIHSENFALKVGMHPATLIPRNIENFTRQLRASGLMIDWRHALSTTDPSYYKWTQWIFLQLLKRGLAYKKAAAVNWCPNDRTVLANEQVIAGACERCGATVEQRFLEQWFFRITDYAGRLLDNLDGLDWSESTRSAQRNWIGKSEGAEIAFRVEEAAAAATVDIRVFTTRPDTIFGATYLVVAPEHPLVDRLTTRAQAHEVTEYRARAARQDLVTRKVGTAKSGAAKTGVFTGSYALNPATGTPIPIWIADYVLMEYGTGAIMAVPGHDERDFEFARVYALPVIRVVASASNAGEAAESPLTAADTETDGAHLTNSAQFDGQSVAEGKAAITEWLRQRGRAKPVVTYRLHDWCISRQRYWGPPIPIIYCDACGTVPVPEADLPVELPFVDDFKPDDSGVSPLARVESWYRVPCPQCGGPGRRETDVSDTFLDSAWYFLRYPSTAFDDRPFDAALTKQWLPVDSYIGGNEHAVLHLLYSRFVTMVLHDAGWLAFEEPFTRFRAHGHIIRDGVKMSKTKGNVVVPDQYVERWGADSFRTYLMFLGPYEEGGDFRDQSVVGVRSFLNRLWVTALAATADGVPDPVILRKLHETIKKVTEDVPMLAYNTAIAAMMEYMNVVRSGERTAHRAEVEPVIQLVAPFAPHIAEELWERFGYTRSVFESGWPSYDAALATADLITMPVQVNGRTRGTIQVPKDVAKDVAVTAAMNHPPVAKFLTAAPKSVVFVPGRLLNIVVGEKVGEK